MQNIIISILIVTLMMFSPSWGGEQQILARWEAVRMLPYSSEGDEPGEYETFVKLIEIGEAAYPALVEELMDTRDSSRIASIVGVFVSSKGDKSVPLQAMTQFVKIHGRDVPTYPGIKAVIRGVGELGSENEKVFLRQYLDLEDVLSRHVVEDSIKLIEKRQEKMKRETSSRDSVEHRAAETVIESYIARGNAPEEENRNGTNVFLIRVGLIAIMLILVLIGFLYYKHRV